MGMATKEDDVVKIMVHSRTKTDVLFFTNKGKVYRCRGYQIPEGSRTSKGIPAVNFVRLEEGEQILSIISVKEYNQSHYFFFTTENGIVKRTYTSEFENINSNGKISITLREGDNLSDVKITDGSTKISIGSSKGKVCTFEEGDVRPMGRTASGVIGMNLDGGKVVGVCTDKDGGDILTISENGLGKRSAYGDFRLTSRGSKGVLAMHETDKSGGLAALKTVNEDEDACIITDGGTVMKTPISQIHLAGRNTIGVKVITLRKGEKISSVAIEPSEKDYEAIDKDVPAAEKTEGGEEETDVEQYLNSHAQEKDEDSDESDDSSSKDDE